MNLGLIIIFMTSLLSISQVHAVIVTEEEYYATWNNITNSLTNISLGHNPPPMPPIPTYEQFCSWYEQNLTQHCDQTKDK